MPPEGTSPEGFSPLEKKGMAATFGGTGGVLLSELLIRNGLDGPAAQASLIGFLVVMVGGCVTLILAENEKKKNLQTQNQTEDTTEPHRERTLASLSRQERAILSAAIFKASN